MTFATNTSRRTPRKAGRSLILLAVALGTFMTYLDNNVVNVAIPSIQRSLHLSQAGIEWVVSAYILFFAGLLLAGGRLADVLGRRLVFLAGLVIFTIASLAVGLAGSADVLIAARAVQGVGAALLTPTTLAILSTTYPDPVERARAIGIWGAVGALALAVGPVIGGTFAQHLSWHWIFFVNVPLGVMTLALAVWAIPADSPEGRRKMDLPGVTASALALFSLTYGLIEGPRDGWTSLPILVALSSAILSGALFVAIEQRVDDPMVDLTLFSRRSFRAGTVAVMLWAFGLFGIYFFTAIYIQDVLGFSATVAGLAFVPMAVLMAAGATVSDRVSERFGAHRVIGTAMFVMGLGISSFALLGGHEGFVALMPGLMVIGIGGGMTIPLTSVVVGSMPTDTAGVASAIFNASREVAGLLGITVIGVILSARQDLLLRHGDAAASAFLSGYHLGLLVAGALVAAGGVVAWVALPRSGADVVPAAEIGLLAEAVAA